MIETSSRDAAITASGKARAASHRSGQSDRLRFAVDTGGTFTDLIVADAAGTLRMHKAATTPSDPVKGVIDVMRVAADAAGQPLSEYLERGEILVHGTTHAINAIITGRTAKTAFLTTKGHPDTLVFREGGRQDSFNFTVPYPAPFISKALTFELEERIMADGTVRDPLDEARAVTLLEQVAASGAESIAVCLLWSIVNPAHELAFGRLIERHLPAMPYTLSHQINPSIREYRRAMSTALDASLKPIMGRYMNGLDGRLREAGFHGRLLVVTSQGGVMDAIDVARAPVHLINSGPSMAPVGAKAYNPGGGAGTLIVGDTGGTTFDVSLVRNGRIPRTRETWLGKPLSSHMTGMPSVDTKSIGAGGGSIAWVDAGGLLHVGPISAGAVPGPAAYGRGGTRPTVTDAAIALGHIDPAHFLGGRMQLDRAAAEAAIRREVADPLGQTVEIAAAAILELATEHMVQAILDITVNQGIDPTEAAFVAGGGAAGLNCVAIGRRLGCETVFVPETGAALAASGALISDLAAHHQAMFHATSADFDIDGVNAILDELEARCRAFQEKTGPDAEFVGIDWTTEARYPDQAWEIEVPLRRSRFGSDQDVEELVSDFHRTHEEIFAISDPGSPIETIGWNATIRCRIGSPLPGRIEAGDTGAALASRPVYFAATGWVDAEVHRFEALPVDLEIEGPAIVESSFTSVVVDPGASARRDATGTLIIIVRS
ncbi:hydantoinase/oxoprolinase family protein [Kaistia adipata]|uniref:hydantoinase/oxoprolinase family protein n=1 Tax=Kaistia adipata TaxID=166954 RepID=UPI00041DB8E2|nr:hydantoinase/oxoprolinase family protein [Kaistia adipata]